MKRTLSFVMVLITVFLLVANVSALDEHQALTTNSQSDATITGLKSAVTILEPFVIRLSNGTFELDPPKKIILQIPQEIYNQIVSGMRIINEQILDGNLVSTKNLLVFSSDSIGQPVLSATISGGVDKVVFRWYGVDIYFSHNTCRLIGLAGGSIPVIVGLIAFYCPPAAPFALPIAAAIALGTIVIAYSDTGNGVIISCLPTGTPFWIASQ